MINHQALKRLAKASKVSVKNLMANFDMPEAALIPERAGWLFDSERSYIG